MQALDWDSGNLHSNAAAPHSSRQQTKCRKERWQYNKTWVHLQLSKHVCTSASSWRTLLKTGLSSELEDEHKLPATQGSSTPRQA
jgi:hypothetical protein